MQQCSGPPKSGAREAERAALLEQVRHIAARLGRRALVKLRADLTGEVVYKLVPPCAYASATTDVHQRTALNRLCRPALKIGTVSTAVRGRPSSASSSASAGTHPYGPVSLARRQRWALGGRRRRTKCLGLALQLEIKGLALAVGRHRHREDRQNVCELHLQRRRVVSSRQRPTSSARLRAQWFPREMHTESCACVQAHTHAHACMRTCTSKRCACGHEADTHTNGSDAARTIKPAQAHPCQHHRAAAPTTPTARGDADTCHEH